MHTQTPHNISKTAKNHGGMHWRVSDLHLPSSQLLKTLSVALTHSCRRWYPCNPAFQAIQLHGVTVRWISNDEARWGNFLMACHLILHDLIISYNLIHTYIVSYYLICSQLDMMKYQQWKREKQHVHSNVYNKQKVLFNYIVGFSDWTWQANKATDPCTGWHTACLMHPHQIGMTDHLLL